MKSARRILLAVLASALASGSLAHVAAAQTFPARPITMVVPYPAGGLFDSVARVLAEHMRKTLGQTVVIENVGGAGGSIAVGRVARAAPDGYTIGIGSDDQFVINAVVYPLQYDVVKDLAPIAVVTSSPNLIVARKNHPANDLKELVTWLKANSTTVAFAHNGAGGLLHRCGLGLQRAAQASWPFITYRGSSPALQDMLGGRIDVMCTSPASSLAMVKNGLLRSYAVTGAERLAAAPDIPTTDEAGVPGQRLVSWGAVFAPAGAPDDVVARLNAALVEALSDPGVRQRLTELGQDISPPDQQNPAALAALQKADIEKWWPIIKAANIKGE
jgi:tripartite-type tricarboxylate transporter receptor subunit TctC